MLIFFHNREIQSTKWSHVGKTCKQFADTTGNREKLLPTADAYLSSIRHFQRINHSCVDEDSRMLTYKRGFLIILEVVYKSEMSFGRFEKMLKFAIFFL